MKLVHITVAIALPTIAACSPARVIDSLDRGQCEQTYEFGNTGCADVVGRVVGSREQPLPGMTVGPRYLPGRPGFNTPYATTDSLGRFHLRLTRFGGDPPTSGPDTVSVFVLAYDPRSSGLNVPATVRDSVLARLSLSPIGQVPVPAVVTIRLPVN